MTYSTDILRYDEQIILTLRTLYAQHGYEPYKLSRFEEYELYAANRAFLPGGDIITFTDAGGRLMALRPDVTLSIVKNADGSGKKKKICYNENVYRTINGELKEQTQIGLECIGQIEAQDQTEILMLAIKSLEILADGAKVHLDVSHTDQSDTGLSELEKLSASLQEKGIKDSINIDLSITGDVSYYTGIIFQGFIEGIPKKVITGGRYDGLLRNFGKSGGAIGFAVCLPEAPAKKQEKEMLGVALPKGRLGETALEMLGKAGYSCPDMTENSRKLVFENPEKGMRYFWVKPSDVAIYVERGIADIGVVGKDTLLETRPDVYELMDLKIGKCRLCTASVNGNKAKTSNTSLRVATKFPNIAREHFAGKGVDIDIIELHGSIELAPLLGLSDVIVDLVETGKTLKDNNMSVDEEITDISARLIANKSAYKFNTEKITELCKKIEDNKTRE